MKVVSVLNEIPENLFEYAAKANYRTSLLAKQCHVSAKTLHRFFREKFGSSTQQVLDHIRLKIEAPKLLRMGMRVKEVAERLGYKHASHFSRAFASVHGQAIKIWLIASALDYLELFTAFVPQIYLFLIALTLSLGR